MRLQIRRAAYFASLVAFAALVTAGAARASTITVFTNFTGTPSFNTSDALPVSGSASGDFVEAMPFTAGSTADLADAVLALGNESADDNSPITLDLDSNSGGVPGTILATLTQQGTIPDSDTPGLVTFDYSGAGVELTSGTLYWLVAVETDAHSIQEWFYSSSDTGTRAFTDSANGTGSWLTHSGTLSAFQVDGTTPTPAPEPGSFTLLAVGLFGGLGLLWVERRRRVSA